MYLRRTFSGGTFNGRMMRNPTNSASVWYQMLCGSCGSCIFHSSLEKIRWRSQFFGIVVPLPPDDSG
ncbi:MAG: hypothetical protein CM1200mP2_10920 [Planctomycetaceae bacterium]|nr:MAG: hypothetical protein CM1200mP2_10920 [Planctomycetaceae bacterium]